VEDAQRPVMAEDVPLRAMAVVIRLRAVTAARRRIAAAVRTVADHRMAGVVPTAVVAADMGVNSVGNSVLDCSPA
jgi:hypothetical protein